MTRVVLDELGRVSACRSCGHAVVWALTERGRPMPLDRDPVPDGLWVVWHYLEEEPIPVHHVSQARSLGEEYRGPRWRTHWATCPSADRHRERERPASSAPAADARQLTLFGGES